MTRACFGAMLLMAAALLTTDAAPITYATAATRRKDKRDCFIFHVNRTNSSSTNVGINAVSTLFGKAQGTGATWTHFHGFYKCGMNVSQVQELAKDPNVLAVEEDQVVTASITQGGATWGLDRTNQRNLPLDSRFTYESAGQGVYVFVLDTGVRGTHVEFSGRMVSGYDAFGAGTTSDCVGHGTHVAGTAAGTTYGLAKRAFIVPVRVLGCDGSGSTTGIIGGIDWVISQTSRRPAVISMSLGGGFSTAFNNAVTNAVNKGITVVVAAGNDNANACNYSPASAAGSITVGSSDSSDSRSSFSNWGGCVDIFAPGSSITSASYLSNTGTAVMSGTSMATPHVTGAVALYLGANPTASPAQVLAALVGASTKNKLPNPGTGSPNRLLYITPLVASTVSVAVGSSGVVSKTVGLPATGLTCPSTCGAGCRLNTDYPAAADNFQLTVAGQQVTARRLDLSSGWGMNLIVPCTQTSSVTVTVGSSAAGTKTITLPQANMRCTTLCGPGCRVNTDYPTAGDTFALQVTGTQLTVTRLDIPGSSWGMNLMVRCYAGVASASADLHTTSSTSSRREAIAAWVDGLEGSSYLPAMVCALMASVSLMAVVASVAIWRRHRQSVEGTPEPLDAIECQPSDVAEPSV